MYVIGTHSPGLSDCGTTGVQEDSDRSVDDSIRTWRGPWLRTEKLTVWAGRFTESILTNASRSRSCRRKERARASEARQIHLEGVAAKKQNGEQAGRGEGDRPSN